MIFVTCLFQVMVGSIALLVLLVSVLLYCIRSGSTSEIKKNLQTKGMNAATKPHSWTLVQIKYYPF